MALSRVQIMLDPPKVVGQYKANGAPEKDQFLTGALIHLEIRDPDGANIADWGNVNGNAETVLDALQIIGNPVILEDDGSSTGNVIFAAVEVDGISADSIEAQLSTLINTDPVLANCEVRAGAYSVDTTANVEAYYSVYGSEPQPNVTIMPPAVQWHTGVPDDDPKGWDQIDWH